MAKCSRVKFCSEDDAFFYSHFWNFVRMGGGGSDLVVLFLKKYLF